MEAKPRLGSFQPLDEVLGGDVSTTSEQGLAEGQTDPRPVHQVLGYLPGKNCDRNDDCREGAGKYHDKAHVFRA